MNGVEVGCGGRVGGRRGVHGGIGGRSDGDGRIVVMVPLWDLNGWMLTGIISDHHHHFSLSFSSSFIYIYVCEISET